MLNRDYQTKLSQRTVGSTDQRRAGTRRDRDRKSHSGDGQRVRRMATVQTSRSVFLDIPLNRDRVAVRGDRHTCVLVDTPPTVAISRRRQDGPKGENCAHPRGSNRDRCPGCLDRPVQRGLFRSGRQPVEDELAHWPVFLENSLSIY